MADFEEYYLILYVGNETVIKAIKDEAAVQHILDTLVKDSTMRALMIYSQKSWVEMTERLSTLVTKGFLTQEVKDKIGAEQEEKQNAGIKKFADALKKRFPKEYEEMEVWKR